MWKDLTLKEKAEIMKMSVANGVTDINDIQQLYDNSVGHRFDNAGKIITTSGSGYFPPIKPEAVIDAAFNYAIGDGKIPIDVVRKRLYDNLYPYSYTSPVTRVHNAVVNNKKEPRIVRNIPNRDDIFAEYLQIPENERHHLPGTMYVRDSEYAPTMGGTNNVKYKKLDLTDAQKEKIILATNSLNFGENRLSKIKHKFDEAKSKPRKYTDTQVAAMVLNSYFGEYTLGKGLDPQKGEYRSYYDLWDLSPVSTYGKDETRGIGKPVPFYDRIYLSDYYGVEPQLLLPYKGDYFGKWLPELVVTNKKALGGHLYDKAGPLNKGKSQPKYQYGIIEQILRENGVNFRVTSGARKPNQAGNAGKSSAHTYTIFSDSPGAIDIVPGVGSDWDTLFAQMNSPKVRRALATYGLDVLNETNPSVMRSTHATGPHLHVGRGIKGQSGMGQMFGGTSYGGGRGDVYQALGRNANYSSLDYDINSQLSQPITLETDPQQISAWNNYLTSLSKQSPITFNTPIGATNTQQNNVGINLTPTDFSVLSGNEGLMSPLEPYAAKQAIEYGLGLENNALWNSPYLMFEHESANGGHLFRGGSRMRKLKDFQLSYPEIKIDKNAIKRKQIKLKRKLNKELTEAEKAIKKEVNEDIAVTDALAGSALSNISGNQDYLDHALTRLKKALGIGYDSEEYATYKPITFNPDVLIKSKSQLANADDVRKANQEYLESLPKEQLKKLQQVLSAKGLLDKKQVDGVYGKNTLNAYNKLTVNEERWNNDVSTEGIDNCAQWVTLKYENATGASSVQNGVFSNAWNMLGEIENHGGSIIYNVYDDSFNGKFTHSELNRKTEKAIKANKLDYSQLQIGDVVGIYIPSSNAWKTALKDGQTKNTHVGIITGFNKNGVPIVEHNIHGSHKRDLITNISGSAIGKAMVSAVARPAYSGSQVSQLHWDPKKSIYTVDEQYSNAQLEEYMNSMAGISEQIQKLYPNVNMEDAQLAALSVLKRETNFMNNKTSDQDAVSTAKEYVGNVARSMKGMTDDTKSSNLSKIKLSTLTPTEKQLLGIHTSLDLEDPKKAGAAALMIMTRNMDYLNRLSEQYPDLGITADDIYNASVLSYNQGMNKLATLGFDKKGAAPQELETLRMLSDPASRIKDVNSTKYKYLGSIGEYLYDQLEEPYVPYIAAANDAVSKYIRRNGEQIPTRASVNLDNNDYINRVQNTDIERLLAPQLQNIVVPSLQDLRGLNLNFGYGGHLFGDGSMLLKDNAVNPALQYVYGPDYERIVREKRNYRPTGNIRRSRPIYDIKQQADVVANTTRPTQRKIKIAKEVESPARRKKEEEIATNRHLQYIRERQGSIQPEPNTLHHPDYNPKFAQEVEELRRKEAEEALKRKPIDTFVGSVLEATEAIPWPSTIVGAYYNPNTHWYDPFSFFSNLYAKDNRGFFNFNQATRDFYDANPEVGGVANLIGDFIAPWAASKVLKGASRASKFAAADIGNSWRTMRYELAHPEAQTLGILPKEFNIPGFKMPISSEEALSKAGEQGYWNSLIDKIEELPRGEIRWQAGQAVDRMRRLVKNEASNFKLLEAVEQARGQATADDITQFLLGRPIKYKTSTEGIERFEGSSKIPAPSRRNTYIDEPNTMHWVGEDYVPIVREKIDDIPNLRQTIEAIEKNIKDEDIIPQFLDGSYISAFKHEAAQQGIDVSSLSNHTIAKILTEQYKQLQSSSSGVLRDNVFWRTWGHDYPAKMFDWQTHIGKSTGNLGFWGQGNYFGTGNYQGGAVNRPYMITGIKQLAYDPVLGPTDAIEGLKAADMLNEFNVLGARPGRADIATRWMSESPETRMVAATPDGVLNTYGILDTGKRGIEVVTQKNTGIKSLVPDLRIGNGETFPRDWSNPNVYLSPDYSKFSFTTGNKTFDMKLFEDFLNGKIESPTQVPKSVPTKNIPKNSTFKVDTDKRLKLSIGSPSRILVTDIGKLTEAEIEAMFGPRAVYWKKMYDVAKNHNFEGKFKAIGEQAEREIRSRFSINREDPDIKIAIDKAKRLYDIPEYRARFEKFGTLGDTFIDDALNRIKNMELQGVSEDYKIIGQHGVEGGASAEAHPVSPKVTIKDSDSSRAIQELTQHEVNHAAHGMKYQPEWMKHHNERIRPKPRRESNTPGAKYMNEMDEIVERAKTTVEWADRIRKPGESLNNVLSRIVDDFENLDGFEFAKKYKDIPGDTKSYLLFFEPKTGKRFLQNFVGSFIVGTTGMSIINQ